MMKNTPINEIRLDDGFFRNTMLDVCLEMMLGISHSARTYRKTRSRGSPHNDGTRRAACLRLTVRCTSGVSQHNALRPYRHPQPVKVPRERYFSKELTSEPLVSRPTILHARIFSVPASTVIPEYRVVSSIRPFRHSIVVVLPAATRPPARREVSSGPRPYGHSTIRRHRLARIRSGDQRVDSVAVT